MNFTIKYFTIKVCYYVDCTCSPFFELKDRHRLDGPAVEYTDGSKEYYVYGKLHRLDGPAREWSDGQKEYYVEGKLHRLDGPAIEYPNGLKEYYVNDVIVTNKLKGIKEEDIPKYLKILLI